MVQFCPWSLNLPVNFISNWIQFVLVKILNFDFVSIEINLGEILWESNNIDPMGSKL